MGRSSNKPPRFQSGGGGGDDDRQDDGAFKHSAEYEAKQIELLLNQKPRISWEEYKEKHKDQLEDKMGMGVEREQADYRRKLDEERNKKVRAIYQILHWPPDFFVSFICGVGSDFLEYTAAFQRTQQ